MFCLQGRRNKTGIQNTTQQSMIFQTARVKKIIFYLMQGDITTSTSLRLEHDNQSANKDEYQEQCNLGNASTYKGKDDENAEVVRRSDRERKIPVCVTRSIVRLCLGEGGDVVKRKMWAS
ncbi:hypothetical protein GJ496_000915 [Pomphorhynchus laevis]|nr:hypothetical protein GJ496_000915 [Pomphorhynchus laevis]